MSREWIFAVPGNIGQWKNWRRLSAPVSPREELERRLAVLDSVHKREVEEMILADVDAWLRGRNDSTF